MKILVTGGCGFIGSAVVRRALALGHSVVNIDKLTYAATTTSIPGADKDGAYTLLKADICDRAAMISAFADHRPDLVMHLAAESHVDRSIDAPSDFVETNVNGTFTMLEVARSFWTGLEAAPKSAFRFHHISTDEVYGALGTAGAFSEATPYAPNSPYSATKAASDHLVRAWAETYGFPVVITNCSNNYGPYQFPEKLIPLTILNALAGRALPVYGKGQNVRDWLYVEDHAEALILVATTGRLGETYNIGGNAEAQNIEIVQRLCAILDDRCPQHAPHANLINFVADRPGHDFRYAIDARKIKSELGWTPTVSLDEGLAKTVEWYLENENWWRAIQQRGHQQSRIGLGEDAD